MLAGLDVSQEKVLSAFRRHDSKNKTNAYMVEGSQAEQEAKMRGDWEAAGEEFKKFQMQFHKASNDAKNASLYVDWQGEEFVSPSERISPEMLAQIVAQNTAFLPNSPTSPRMVMFSFGACLSGCQ